MKSFFRRQVYSIFNTRAKVPSTPAKKSRPFAASQEDQMATTFVEAQYFYPCTIYIASTNTTQGIGCSKTQPFLPGIFSRTRSDKKYKNLTFLIEFTPIIGTLNIKTSEELLEEFWVT